MNVSWFYYLSVKHVLFINIYWYVLCKYSRYQVLQTGWCPAQLSVRLRRCNCNDLGLRGVATGTRRQILAFFYRYDKKTILADARYVVLHIKGLLSTEVYNTLYSLFRDKERYLLYFFLFF